MNEKLKVVLHIVIIVLTLVLTIVYAIDGDAVAATAFAIIFLLNCVALLWRKSKQGIDK